jgi:Fe-S oxidoreductase/nitrate reductase gamma subunit
MLFFADFYSRVIKSALICSDMESDLPLVSSSLNLAPILETRELWWNIDTGIGKIIFYFLAFASIAIFLYGYYSKIKHIFKGKSYKEDRFSNIKARILNVFTFGLLHKKIKEKKSGGLAHIAVFVGFVTLWIVTCIVAFQEHIEHFVELYFFQGSFYKLVSFVADIAGVLLLVGVIAFAIRRYVLKSRFLDNTQKDWIQLVFLAFFVVTGFVLEAFRMVATGQIEDYAPIGAALARFFSYMTIEDLKSSHAMLWWLHSIMTFAFIALIPYTKFLHILTAPLTMFFKSERPRGQLSTPFSLLEMMEAEAEGKEVNEEDFVAGVFTYDDFQWKSLLDAEACTSCGRCHVVCPAQNTEKPLSPKHLMLDIRGLAHKEGREEVYNFISPEVLWSCTTCNACVEQCPVLIEHVDTIVDMRRGLLQSNMAPSNLQATLKNLRTKSNPWGLDPKDREKWRDELKSEKGLEVKLARENKGNFEYLYWVGSPGAYDDKSKVVTKANAELFTKAGISFAVLGNEEKTSGDLARRSGDEGLFQEIVLENIEILKNYGVKKIITQCPHVYNTFKNEYPEFGLDGVEIYHHSEILAKAIIGGQLTPAKEVQETYTYHDPCYLGRYNRVFDPPRFILESIPGLVIKHIDNEKEKSTCCGGGGAQMWYETPGNQINIMRFEELNEHNPNKVSVACPYCSVMLNTSATTAFPGTNIPEIEDIALTLAKSAL